MENIVCFLCDIRGTLDGMINNTEEDYREFNQLILKIKESTGADRVLFSLVSTEPQHLVIEEVNTLKTYLKPPIIFGRQYFSNGYIEGEKIVNKEPQGKIVQIIGLLNDLREKYTLQSIYYLDDCELFQEMLSDYVESISPKEKLYSIVPTEGKGLSELNLLLKNQVNQEKIYRKEKS